MTAIIVNRRGEVFTHWVSCCSVGVSGDETYYSEPSFGKPRVELRQAGGFWPYPSSQRRYRNVNRPYVFSSVQAARKALVRMGWFGLGAAVVS